MFLFNFSKFIITKNNVKYDNSKKNIILIIKKSPGEIDWILPLLFNLEKKFNIFTIFQKKITLDLLKSNFRLDTINKLKVRRFNPRYFTKKISLISNSFLIQKR